MALATLLLPGDEGSPVSKRTADATKALKQATDVISVPSNLPQEGTPSFVEPEEELPTATATKYAAYDVQRSYAAVSRTATPPFPKQNLAGQWQHVMK